MNQLEWTEHKRAQVLQALQEVGKAITAALTLRQVLEIVAEQALKIVEEKSETGDCVSHIALLEEGERQLNFTAAYPLAVLSAVRAAGAQIDLKQDTHIGVAGRSIREKHSQIVDDVTRDPDYLSFDPKISSQVSIPLKFGDEIIGVLSLEHYLRNAFDNEDVLNLETLAAQAAIAIQNARHAEEKNRIRHLLQAANSDITEPGDLNKVLQSVLEIISNITGAGSAVMATLDQKGELNVPLTFGLNYSVVLEEIIRPRGVTQKVLEEGQPRFIENTEAEEGLNPALTNNGIRAAACLPLTLFNKPVGVIWLHFYEERRFSKTERQALLTYARRAAIAITYEAGKKRAEVLGLLLDTSKALSSMATIEEILQYVAEKALSLTGDGVQQEGSFSHVALLSGKTLRYLTSSPVSMLQEIQENGKSINLSDLDNKIGISGRAIRTSQTQNAGKVEAEKDYLTIRPEISSQLSVPLLPVGDHEPIGVISIEHPRTNAFSQEDVNYIELLAAQAAIAIRNLKQARGLEALNEATQAINRPSSKQKMLDIIVQQALRLVGADSKSGCFAHISEMTGQGLRFVSTTHPQTSERERGFEAIIDLTSKKAGERISIAGRAARTRETQNVGDVTQDCDYVEIRKTTSSQLSVPLKWGNNNDVTGVLNIEHTEPNAFTVDDVRNVEKLAHIAAAALKKAELLENTKKRAKAFEALVNSAGIINSEIAQQHILENIASEAVRIVGLARPADNIFSYLALLEGGKLKIVAVNTPDVQEKIQKFCDELNKTTGSWKGGIIGRAIRQEVPQNVPDVTSDPDYKETFQSTRSQLSVPLLSESVRIVLTIEHPEHAAFGEDEVRYIEVLAGLAAVALKNAGLHDAARKRAVALEALNEAARAITRNLDKKRTLDKIAQKALEIVSLNNPMPEAFSHIGEVADQGLLVFRSAWPCERGAELQRRNFQLDLKDPANNAEGKLSLAGWVVKHGVALNCGDVSNHSDYVEFNSGTRSQLSVPMKIGDEVIGVLSLEHPELNAFKDEDQRILEALAAQAAVAIWNADLYEDQDRLVFKSLEQHLWRHSVPTLLKTIKDEVHYCRSMVARWPFAHELRKILSNIEMAVDGIRNNPNFSRGLAAEDKERLLAHEFIVETVQAINLKNSIKNGYSVPITLECHEVSPEAAISINKQFMIYVLNILIENAVRATTGLEYPSEIRVIVENSYNREGVQIAVVDNGPGIPPELWRRLFVRPILKRPGEMGQGHGLHYVYRVVRYYQGTIQHDRNYRDPVSHSGTRMLVWLPLVN